MGIDISSYQMLFFYFNGDILGFVTTMAQVRRATGLSLSYLRQVKRVGFGDEGGWIVAYGRLEKNQLKNNFK